ncbi:MAG: magnesium-protoporphyrin IX monomethyl ester (oxidative) cyclase [Candidatus Velthaea sp.]
MSEAPQLLRPRLYRTDNELLNSLNVDWLRAEFEEMRRDFEADWNRSHFKWDEEALDIDYDPLWSEFYEFLHRSAIGEFSGCLLYSDVCRKISDPSIAAIYKSMARDEGRHASFLNWVMRQMGRRFDLQNLPKVQGLQYMHPKWIFVTTYLSEIVGFYRYQNISDHLKRHPEYRFHPIFKYFDEWCKDERRHSRFFALMMRSQPQFLRGRRNRFAIKFFTIAVYVTMYLRDFESTVYARLGMDWEKFDLKVINETEQAAREVWGLGIRTRSRFFLGCLRAMARNNTKNRAGREATGLRRFPAFVMRYARYANNVLQYAKLMLQPHDTVPQLTRDRWTEACAMPADGTSIALPGVAPVILQKRPAAVA